MIIKKVIFIILFLTILVLGWAVFNYYHKNIRFLGSVKIRVYPPDSSLKINEKIYNSPNGIFNIKLPPGNYLLNFFHTGYLNYEKNIKIEPGERIVLENIYLLPLNWKKTVLVEDSEIKNISLSGNNNRIFYISQTKEKNSKVNYVWYIFNRETKEKEEVFNSPSFPLKTSFVSRKILAELKENNWQIILPSKSLLRDLNILTQSLNNLFERQLKNLELKLSKNIQQAIFKGTEDNEIIIRTNDALFLFNLLEEKLELIYNGETSPFILSKNNLYFIDKSGLLTRADISSPFLIQSLSLFSFGEKNLDKIQIIKYPLKEIFLILDANNKLYYFNPQNQSLPLLIKEDIQEADFSLIQEGIIVFKELNKENWVIYDFNNQQIKEIESKNKPINLISQNYWLILKENKLGIYDLSSDNFSLIDENINEDFLYFDPVLKKIFYAKNNQIIEVSY